MLEKLRAKTALTLINWLALIYVQGRPNGYYYTEHDREIVREINQKRKKIRAHLAQPRG